MAQIQPAQPKQLQIALNNEFKTSSDRRQFAKKPACKHAKKAKK